MNSKSRSAGLLHRAAFTLAELMVTVGIVGITSASALVLGARTFNLIKSSNDLTLASQTLQERMEQFRSASWMTLTSEEVPGADDDDNEDADDNLGDLTLEVLTEPTAFPDDLEDTKISDPGLLSVLSKAPASASDLQEVVENVTVARYPAASTPIKVRRNKDGTTTVLSHNADLVYENSVRVVLELTWRNKANGQLRTITAQTVITKSTE